jgi:SAM-dependent methyltransferase
MSLLDEYRSQYAWRDWKRALSLCPALPGQHVLDLGCGPGDISAELSARGLSVLGIDGNADLLSAAKSRCPDCRFEKRDLGCLGLTPAAYDGIWSSFTAAYFVNFERTSAHWASFLKPAAWVCVIEVDDLLGHKPLSESTERKIAAFYEEAAIDGRYDFRMGGKIGSVLSGQGFRVTSVTLDDQELSFDGPASADVVQAWKNRLARMGGLQVFFGSEFPTFQDEFIRCISASDHRSLCNVVCSVGVRA